MRTFGLATLVFLPMAAVGTQVHEWGHFGAYLALGWSPELHYGSVFSGGPPAGGGSSAGRQLAIAMGPLTNMAVGTLGLVWLWRRRRDRVTEPLDRLDWLATLAALFWSRQLFNLLLLLRAAALGASRHRGDEARLSLAAGLPFWTLDALGGLVAAVVCARVVLWTPQPLGFCGGAVLGSVLGFGIWFGWLGPLLLP